MLVTLQDSKEVVIQFRPEPLDIGPFKVARQALGQIVPDIELLKDEELEYEHIWAYWMNCIPGKVWLDGVRGGGPKAIVTINKSLGRILSRGYVEGNSANVIDSKLRPHLEMLVSTQKSEIQPFQEVAQEFLGKLDQLKVLPLFISHFDLNQVNILIDENYEVSGVVDWELSSLLPFGMGLAKISLLPNSIFKGLGSTLCKIKNRPFLMIVLIISAACNTNIDAFNSGELKYVSWLVFISFGMGVNTDAPMI
ncbi:hypothetical protein BGZ60DRAFT_563634 [Tricladium varicosporioides]|nr:hypothetical protein BGZ60DRAFT_563634 [Hymenoscyphus varicosporioides]